MNPPVWLIAGITAAAWIPVGVTGSRLRVFVDKASIMHRGDLIAATIRVGSPGAIAGRIVLVYQQEEFDCRARRWRLLGYRALDADNKTVSVKAPASAPPPLLDVEAGSMGEATLDTVCFIAGSR